MRVALAFSVVLALGCADAGPAGPRPDPLAGLAPWSDAWIAAHASIYLDDESARREALEGSLTNDENSYSSARLASYGRASGGWDALPAWSPRAVPLSDAIAESLARGDRPPAPADAAPLWDGERPEDFAGWAALGERVFFEMPLRSERVWEVALEDPELASALGIVRASDGTRPGLVWMTDVDGRGAVGITCALCHARIEGSGGEVIAGRARRELDYGGVRIAFADRRGIELDPVSRARFASWGPGRADVSEEVADTPIAIPDLWELRERRYLAQAGTITHTSPIALAIRQETQFIQANHHHTRPPRELAFALAVYLYAITPPPARAPESPELADEGAALFDRTCARCHADADGSGELVALADIGTDPELGGGSARGTGAYRPAPLVRVGDAAPYLHHGAVDTLESMLDPAREEPGHRFGTELSSEEREALLAHLRRL